MKPSAPATMLSVFLAACLGGLHAAPLCDIIKDGTKFDGKVIRVVGLYSTAPEDFPAAIHTEECRGSIDDVTTNGAGDKSVVAFVRVVNSDFLPQTFALDVSGKFHWNKRWSPTSALLGLVKRQPHGELEITHVWRFRKINR